MTDDPSTADLRNGRPPEDLPEEEPLDVAVVDDDPRMLFRPTNQPELLPRLSRAMCSVIGIDEDVLAWAPEERPRYTRLGAIVLNTGLMRPSPRDGTRTAGQRSRCSSERSARCGWRSARSGKRS